MAEAKKKVRMPSALKRDQLHAERQKRHRSFKSRVTTALRGFRSALTEKDATATKTSLNTLNSLMDKGLKKGIYKLNKVRRVKSRLSARAQKGLSA